MTAAEAEPEIDRNHSQSIEDLLAFYAEDDGEGTPSFASTWMSSSETLTSFVQRSSLTSSGYGLPPGLPRFQQRPRRMQSRSPPAVQPRRRLAELFDRGGEAVDPSLLFAITQSILGSHGLEQIPLTADSQIAGNAIRRLLDVPGTPLAAWHEMLLAHSRQQTSPAHASSLTTS